MKYSDNDKAIALATLDANEGNVNRTAKQLKMAESTLRSWLSTRKPHMEVARLCEVKKQELSEKLEKVAHALTDNILIRAESDFSVLIPLKDFAVTLGIAIDKMQLLKGQATQIVQDVTKYSNEERADRVLKLLQQRKAG